MPLGWNSELEVMRRAVTAAASHRFLIWPASRSLFTDDVFDLTEVHVDDSLIATAAPLTIENSGIDPLMETGRGPCVWASPTNSICEEFTTPTVSRWWAVPTLLLQQQWRRETNDPDLKQ